MKRRICVVTGTRAEYGLLYWLMREINADDGMELRILVTGMHLSTEFGLTYRQIEQDGFLIDEKVEMLLASDTPAGITKSLGIGLIGLSDALERLRPDLLVLLGDRFEALAAAEAALLAGIPVAHIHGGEITAGSVDDSIRHAITKMSQLHFAALPEYRQRIIQMGEDPAHVHEVGALGLDNILRLPLMTLPELEASLDFRLGEDFFLVTFHPATAEAGHGTDDARALLDALDAFPGFRVILTKANADVGGREINRMLEAYAEGQPGRVFWVDSLGQRRYLSAMRLCRAVVGNSSSGLLEAPLLHTPTVNIGTRQEGRHREASVIDCAASSGAIREALKRAVSSEFRQVADRVQVPYADGRVALRIKKVLKEVPLEAIARKRFHDQIP